jgi:hypothetical protein
LPERRQKLAVGSGEAIAVHGRRGMVEAVQGEALAKGRCEDLIEVSAMGLI